MAAVGAGLLQIFKNCILVGKKIITKLNLNNSPIGFYLKGAAFVAPGIYFINKNFKVLV